MRAVDGLDKGKRWYCRLRIRTQRPFQMPASIHCLGALALEIAATPARMDLPRAEAESLAGHVADDLQRLLPEVQALDLVLDGAHFDPAEILRPSWPVHAALASLAQRAPGSGGARVIAFGNDGEQMPSASLAPDPALAGGALRLVPFALMGPAPDIARVGAAMEERLIETGMAGAATALFAQQGFGGRLEHARYLTLHDLCALMAMQYEHAGLAPLWPLIEAALLAPHSEEWLDAPPEPIAHLVEGSVRIAHPAFDAWAEAGMAPRGDPDPARLSRAFAAHNARLRQLTAVLTAHAIPVEAISVGTGGDPRAALR
jgi:hypothetical protein